MVALPISVPMWSLGLDALQGSATWGEVLLPEAMWPEYARLARLTRSPREVYIALAVEAEVRGAAAAFERAYFCVAERALDRVGATPAETSDLLARLREYLFAPGMSPLLAYAGRGELRTLLRVTVLRAFVDQRLRAMQPAIGNRAALLPLLDTLPDHLRIVARLCVLHGLDAHAIAKRLHCEPSVIERRMQKLQPALAAAGADEIWCDVIDVLVDVALA